MTIIVETNTPTFKRIDSGELTFIVHKFSKTVVLSDTLIFQEIKDDGTHTGEELIFKITQKEVDGCKTGYTAVAFTPKS